MSEIIEQHGGMFIYAIKHEDGKTFKSVPFEKDSETYKEKLDEGYELVLIPQSEKDAHEAEQAISQAIAVIQGMLDSTAQSKGYDNINSAIGYAEEPSVEKFQLEGKAFRQWRSLCWAKCYELQAGGVMPDDLLSEMPRLEL